MDEKFYRNVAEEMKKFLPKPRPKLKDIDGGVIPIITVTCEGVEW